MYSVTLVLNLIVPNTVRRPAEADRRGLSA